MKIGIPRSLFYYYYGDLWVNFFKYLNVDLIISPKTNKEILNLGIKYSIDEMCLSLKNYIGHVMYLKDKCDYILIPRIDNYGLNNQMCTNYLAIYDIVNNLDNLNILNYNINLRNNETELNGLISICEKIGISKKSTKEAYNYALDKVNQIRTNKIFNNLKKLQSEKKKILLVGHSYNIYDSLIGTPIIKMLEDMDIEIIYSDLFFSKDKSSKYAEDLYWKYSRDNISSITKSINYIDGIIFISVFPCALDSLVNELVMRKLDKPYLNLIIDDIESSGGIETRLESFVDIINS